MTAKLADPDAYAKRVAENKERQWLIDRVRGIRQQGIRKIIVPEQGDKVYETFEKEHLYLKRRSQRDYPRLFSFIKSHALLNCFNREKVGADTIVATDKDIEAGFKLYREIEMSNDLGLSPYLFQIYKEVIEPLLNPEIGVSRKQIRAKYFSVFHSMLSPKMEDGIIGALETAGLIYQAQDPDDRRRTAVLLPMIGNNAKEESQGKNQECIPRYTGVNISNDSSDEKISQADKEENNKKDEKSYPPVSADIFSHISLPIFWEIYDRLEKQNEAELMVSEEMLRTELISSGKFTASEATQAINDAVANGNLERPKWGVLCKPHKN